MNRTFHFHGAFLLLLLIAPAAKVNAAPPITAKELALPTPAAPAWLPSPAEVEDRLKSLGTRKRNADPFGLSMFPTEKNTKAGSTAAEHATDRVSLSQAVRSLKIGLVNPAGKEFVVHGNNVYQGDTITLAFKGEAFAAQVTEVTAFRIVFTDLKSHDIAWVPLTIIPSLKAVADGTRRTGPEQKYLLPMEPFNRTK